NDLTCSPRLDQECVSAECPRNLFTGRSDGPAVAREASETSDVSVSAGPPDAGVREPLSTRPGHNQGPCASKRPAHPRNRLVAELNSNWRVVDDPLQWVLHRRKGKSRSKNSGWQGRSFCTTREALLRCIRKHCCSTDHCGGECSCLNEAAVQ